MYTHVAGSIVVVDGCARTLSSISCSLLPLEIEKAVNGYCTDGRILFCITTALLDVALLLSANGGHRQAAVLRWSCSYSGDTFGDRAGVGWGGLKGCTQRLFPRLQLV